MAPIVSTLRYRNQSIPEFEWMKKAHIHIVKLMREVKHV